MKNIYIFLVLILTVNTSFAQYDIFWGDKANQTLSASASDMDLTNTLAEQVEDISRVQLDGYAQKVYWVEQGMGKIWKANFDGSNAKAILQADTKVNSFAVDHKNEKIYFAEDQNHRIMVADLDGKNLEVFTTGVGIIKGIGFDHAGQQIFWTDLVHGNITSIGMDGLNKEVIFENEDFIFFDLAVDNINEQLYFSDRANNSILRIDFFGEMLTEVIELNSLAGTIALDAEYSKIFYKEGDQLNMANMDGTDIVMLEEGIMELTGLAIFNENMALPMAQKK